MTTIEAARLLYFSGAAAILFSSAIGFVMLVPLQHWGQRFAKGLNFKQFGAAHLDWIMLGLMQGLAGAIITGFSVEPSYLVVWAMIFGAWINPLSYVFRGFGINAFAFDGGFTQRTAALLGLSSSLAIVCAWFAILRLCWTSWP